MIPKEASIQGDVWNLIDLIVDKSGNDKMILATWSY
jgi:hypothetical protein